MTNKMPVCTIGKWRLRSLKEKKSHKPLKNSQWNKQIENQWEYEARNRKVGCKYIVYGKTCKSLRIKILHVKMILGDLKYPLHPVSENTEIH